jgi:hypothetical protein
MNRTISALFIISFLFIATVIQDVAAQSVRNDVWLEASTGTGGIFFNCSACESPIRTFGESVHFRIGGKLSDRVLLGFEVYSLISKTFQPTGGNEIREVEISSFAPVVIWYPWRYGLFLKGGFGFSRGEVETAATEETPAIIATGIGSGMSVGAGIDLPIFKYVAVSLQAGIFIGALGDVTVDDTVIDDLISTSYSLSVGLVLR